MKISTLLWLPLALSCTHLCLGGDDGQNGMNGEPATPQNGQPNATQNDHSTNPFTHPTDASSTHSGQPLPPQEPPQPSSHDDHPADASEGPERPKRTTSLWHDEMSMAPLLTDPVTLDLLVQDPLQFAVFEDNEDEIKHRDFYPEGNRYINKITEGDAIIWEAMEGQKCVYAEVFSGESMELLGASLKVTKSISDPSRGASKTIEKVDFKFFEKKDGMWNGITSEQFHDIIEGIEEKELANLRILANAMDGPSTSGASNEHDGEASRGMDGHNDGPEEPLEETGSLHANAFRSPGSLDDHPDASPLRPSCPVSHPDTPIVKPKRLHAGSRGGPDGRSDLSKKLNDLKISQNGQTDVSECNENDGSEGALENESDQMSRHADAEATESPKEATASTHSGHQTPSILTHSGDAPQGNPFERVQKGYTTTNPFLPINGPIILDIANPDKFLVGVEEDFDGETKNVILEPRDDICVVSIVENGVPIWSSTRDERCVGIEFSSSENYAVVYLDIREEKEITAKCFEKVQGEWKENNHHSVI